ncbi:MAG TPA: NAD(P)H-dependent oxidoreductase subunit E [Anaerolineaceae bacterium]|jgi:NADH-quinone oxidoreductase subunit E|nr:NAD(P)H-dependent oxidoreductase subunit E [Anaerolineaceae bacterium]
MNLLLQQSSAEVEQILVRYPAEHRRAAVMPLLFLAQRTTGRIDSQALADIAEITGLSTTDVASIMGFYTLFHAEEDGGGRFRIQVCTDMPCALRGARQFLAAFCEALGIQPGQTTPDGLITVEEVKCLAACDHAPFLQVQGDGELVDYPDQTVESALALVETLRQKPWARY